MVAFGIGAGQQQFHRPLRLAQSRHGGRARGIDGKDQHAVGFVLVSPGAQVGGQQDQPPPLFDQPRIHPRARRLPRRCGAQGRHKVDAGIGAGRAAAGRQGAPAPVALACGTRAAGPRFPRPAHGKAFQQVGGQHGPRSLDQHLGREILRGLVAVFGLPGVRVVLGRRWRFGGAVVGLHGGQAAMGKDQFGGNLQVLLRHDIGLPQGRRCPGRCQRHHRRAQRGYAHFRRRLHQRHQRAIGHGDGWIAQSRRLDRRIGQRGQAEFAGQHAVKVHEQRQPVGQRAGQAFAVLGRLVQRHDGTAPSIQRLRDAGGKARRAVFGHSQHQKGAAFQQARHPHQPPGGQRGSQIGAAHHSILGHRRVQFRRTQG